MVKVDQFALRIREPKDAPAPLLAFYEKARADGLDGYVVYAPPITDPPARHRQVPAGHLLMIGDDRLRIAIDRGVVEEVEIPFADLIFAEIGEALLFSWMRLGFGRHTSREIKIPFNTVGIELFRQALFSIRKALDVSPDRARNSRADPSRLPFKFQSELRRWLLEDEQIFELAFQPEIRTHRFIVFARQLVPPTLLALTDRQFFCITEEPPVARERLSKYSSVYLYCPLSRLESLTLETDEVRRGVADFRICLANDQARFQLAVKVCGDELAQFARFCRRIMEVLNKSACEGALRSQARVLRKRAGDESQ